MNVKKILTGLLLLVAVFSVTAFVTKSFKNWDDVVKYSSYIFIAQCTSSQEPKQFQNGVEIVFVGANRSHIQIVSVLKGKGVLPGAEETLESQYWPYQGEKYLIFADYCDGSICQALADYDVIPLGHRFPMNMLDGKALDEQVKAILQYRLENLNRELEQGQTEKKRLEQAFPPGSPTPASQK